MKKLVAVLVLFFMLSIVGCGKGVAEERFSHEGIFIPCENGNYCIYIEDEGLIEFSTGIDEDIFAEISIGDRIRIVHGTVAESYPAQTIVYSIEKIEDGSIEDIPTDILSDLESLGRSIISL